MSVLSVYRSENKYLINQVDANNIMGKMGILLNRDDHSENNSYIVRSLYFDSINNIDFSTKLAGTEIRKKIRIRVYSPNDKKCKLELKEKNGDLQHKTSVVITKEDAEELIKGNFSVLIKYFAENEAATRIYTIMTLGNYRPVVMIEYDRVAFTNPLYNTRITFDMNVRASESNFDLFDENINYNMILNNQIILEVKFNERLLETISDILKPYHLNRLSISKYGLSRKNYINFGY